jgi:hypothetical protein
LRSAREPVVRARIERESTRKFIGARAGLKNGSLMMKGMVIEFVDVVYVDSTGVFILDNIHPVLQ